MDKGLRREPLVMQSYGGVLGIDDACGNAVGMIESGPASGVAGSRSMGQQLGNIRHPGDGHGRNDIQGGCHSRQHH